MSPTPSRLIYSLMQRKHIESSDKEQENYYCPETRGGKRLKTEEEEEQSIKRVESEECLDFLTEKEELGARFWKERRKQIVSQVAQQPWTVTASCNRLHALEEYILELGRVTRRSESIRNHLQEQHHKSDLGYSTLFCVGGIFSGHFYDIFSVKTDDFYSQGQSIFNDPNRSYITDAVSTAHTFNVNWIQFNLS